MGSHNTYYAWKVAKKHRELKERAVEYKGGRCEVCGYNKCLTSLVFHHEDPSAKDFTISGRVLRWETIKGELDKCRCLCANCHGELHDREYLQRMLEREVEAQSTFKERKYKPKQTVECAVCSNKFSAHFSNRPRARYCDRLCKAVAQRAAPWPDDQTLLLMINNNGVSATARELKATRKAIRKAQARIMRVVSSIGRAADS
jgi:hypothetical protein